MTTNTMKPKIDHNDVETDRHTYIGGSDIAAVMGMSRWKTPLQLWAEKTLRLVPEIKNPTKVKIGKIMEEGVAIMFTEETGKQVRRAPKAYTHPEYSFMKAHLDRLITGTDELLECKNTGEHNKNEWIDDEIPYEYILQVIWGLGLSKKKKGYIAVFIGGGDFKHKEIEFDSELFAIMVERAKKFWNCVKNDIPPAVMPQDGDTLRKLYLTHSNNYIELYDDGTETLQSAIQDFNTAVANLQEIKEHIKSLTEEKTEIETNIKNLIKGELGIKTDKYIVTWREKVTKALNIELLKQNEPEIFKQYAIETIDAQLLKKEQPDIANEYTLVVSTTRALTVKNNEERQAA